MSGKSLRVRLRLVADAAHTAAGLYDRYHRKLAEASELHRKWSDADARLKGLEGDLLGDLLNGCFPGVGYSPHEVDTGEGT